MRRGLPVVALLLGGCLFQNVSSEERLRDAVVGLNDEARWHRIDLAVQRVAAPFKGRFQLTHHSWGRTIQIADSEILNVEVSGEDREVATSWVAVRWYRHDQMILADTMIQQRWERVPGGYLLTSEEVVEGNPELLDLPEGVELPSEAAPPDGDGETAARDPGERPRELADLR